MIKEVFKHQSGHSMGGHIPSIPFNAYTDIVAKQLSLVDNKVVKYA